MLHHHGGAGAGSPYMDPMAGAAPFAATPTGPLSVAAIPPPPMQLQPAGMTSANFEELPAGGSGAGAAASLVQDDDMPADVVGAGGRRWPREETLALIRIRTEMDADFRNAPLKAPLWEDVARKLAGLGYHRSAKKCKEKFENVDKYYRRTKDARAGRQDGKSYRFFSQLEALHATAAPPPQQQQQGTGMALVQADHPPLGTMAWTAIPATLGPPAGAGGALPDLSFSSMSGSESDSGSDDDFDVGEASLGKGESDGGGGVDREMMAIFEGMMKQVTEKQDAMQRVFLETLERWESERSSREEAWRRQEVARMNREREQLARERAAAASRDAALIAFLQRVGGGQGEPVRLPPPITVALPMPAAPMPYRAPPSPRHDAAAASLQLVPALPKPEEARPWAGGEGSGSMPSRWPKEEVHALIQLRTEKDEQYHDAGAKGPLWEDIAAGMRRIGYNRSAKRCKEKWENINKYYKKVKESNKRRPEDSKTCPYFHQLDAMYRKKRFAGRGSSTPHGANAAAVAVTVQENPNQRELEGKSSNDVDMSKNDGQVNVHAPPGPGNGETAPTTTATDAGDKNKMAEDNVKETSVQLQQQQQFGADETDSDDSDMGGDYTEEGDDEDKTKHEMGFQKPDMIGSSGDVPAPPATASAPMSSAAPTSSTFLAVQ
ncbi:Trihelix transcription factor GT-2 [Dichanthelium oligosanthes]|uniref:Trihelix transcription factor GT-2 n=1 Tax=Dichanthelium oligosanthes TaxID=888268 RepID=A0A1E5VUT8_9POAL|nr:Trihelix transcription factor GT-2 [Dichanthelium oligosanthes]